MPSTSPVVADSLAALTLPSGYPLTRQPPARCKLLADTFWDKYDQTTLVYDCIYSPANRQLRLFLPKVLNLQAPLKKAQCQIDNTPAIQGKWCTYRHFDTIDLPLKATPTQLKITLPELELQTPVSIADPTAFANSNVLFTLSRDNDLEWITDWVVYHQKIHQANAVIIADNASSKYSATELLHTLRSIHGIKNATVISVPFRYGPGNKDTTRCSDAQFLQPALLNIIMNRYLRDARAVVNLDIDELLVPVTGKNIFDAVVKSLSGLITFQGHWRYTDAPTEKVRHAHHINANPADKPCPTKYALKPDSIPGRRCLQVHTVAGIHRNLFRSREFYYLHCRGISTGWKYARDETSASRTRNHTEQQLLHRAFT